MSRAGFFEAVLRLEAVDDVRENVTNGWAEQRQDDNDDDGDQNQDQGIFNETLTLFTWHVHHNDFSPSMR
jgi:hypothetical protein